MTTSVASVYKCMKADRLQWETVVAVVKDNLDRY